MSSLLRRGWQAVLDLVFPDGNVCQLCGQPLQHEHEIWLCDPCDADLQAAAIPPSDQPLFIDPAIPCAVAAFAYGSVAQELVHNLKYRSAAAAVGPLALGMARAFAEASSGALLQADVLIPIPLHPKRKRERGYNQSELLSQQLSLHIGIPSQPHALERIRNTKTQVSTAPGRRTQNVAGAFVVADIPLIYQKRVLLIDDVCTSGATSIACAQVLLACGAKEVALITACRA